VCNNHDLPPDQPAEASAPHLHASPLDRLLESAIERSTDPTVKKWLLALLNSAEQAEGRAKPPQPGAPSDP
jgi:hypothetical protein